MRASRARALWIAALCAGLAGLAAGGPALAQMQIGKFTVTFVELDARHNGDFIIPGAVNGVSSDGDFRADRAFGNYNAQIVTLVGHVVLHRRTTRPPMTLTSRQLRVEGKRDVYTATGSVVVVQGNRRLQSDYLRLDDSTNQGILRGRVSARENDRVVNTSELTYNTLTGALLVPQTLTGFSPGTDFRADRGFGNNKAGTFTLTGNVVVHRFNYGKANNSGEPLTLWCDKLDIANRPEVTYTATGHVKVAQGDRTLSAPVLRLNDTTHVADMTGGVHGEEKPDRTFDAAELLYNTQTEDFKALGGVRATFPFRRGGFAPTPTPSPQASAPTKPTPAPSAAEPPQSPQPSATPHPVSSPSR